MFTSALFCGFALLQGIACAPSNNQPANEKRAAVSPTNEELAAQMAALKTLQAKTAEANFHLLHENIMLYHKVADLETRMNESTSALEQEIEQLTVGFEAMKQLQGVSSQGASAAMTQQFSSLETKMDAVSASSTTHAHDIATLFRRLDSLLAHSYHHHGDDDDK